MFENITMDLVANICKTILLRSGVVQIESSGTWILLPMFARVHCE